MDYNMLVGGSGDVGSIARWLNYSPVSGDAPEIVVEAESWIYRRLRHWRMFGIPATGTLTIGQDYLTNPADMLEPSMLITTGQYYNEIIQKPYQEVVFNYAYTGNGNTRVQQQPVMYYISETAMFFDSPPDRAYGYSLLYFKQPAALSTGNPTNFVTQYYPRLLRCACMAAGCEFAKDGGQGNFDRTYWDGLAQDEIDKAQAESDRARRSIVAGMVLQGGGVASMYPAYTNGY